MTIFDTAHSAARDALRLAQSLATAAEIQWERSPVPQPREDTTERASGGHGDPTGDIALDARRLAVREAVVNAEATLARAADELLAAKRKLDHAVARWNGE